VVFGAAACSGAAASRVASTPATPTSTTTTTSTTAPAPTVPPTTATTVPAGPPYQVGSTVVNLVDASRPTVSHGRTVSPSRALTTLVWYPQVSKRSPLIVFAHGYQVGPAPYETMLESWAAHGYVVAAPEFPLTDQSIAGANLDENDINNQPDDLRFVTDSLVAGGSPVASRIEASRVAVAGHSDGAETALAASVAPTPAGEPAYRALVAMSVQELPGVSHTANPPMLVTQGDADTINPPSYGYTAYQDGSSPKFLLVIRGGEHLPPLQAGSAWLPGLEAATEGFLDAYVASDGPVGKIGSAIAGSSLFALSSG
jgi:acetyl esterase/lipase